jgi:hypothetical protein
MKPTERYGVEGPWESDEVYEALHFFVDEWAKQDPDLTFCDSPDLHDCPLPENVFAGAVVEFLREGQ